MKQVPERVLLDLEIHLRRIQRALQTWEAYLPWQGEAQAIAEVEACTRGNVCDSLAWLERFFATCEQHGFNAREEACRKAITLHPLAHYQERLANYLSPGQLSSMSAPDMAASPLCPNNISDRKE